MEPEQAKALREPFPPEQIGKLPRVTCKNCRDARGRVCDQHRKDKCRECGNYITTAHMHLDYVGHAETTDRLLAVDPHWSWTPLATDDRGLPAFDERGGLWITLTVAGVARLGYGAADGKQGPDAVKECIGDAIRNAAMRFGVALDLWAKTDLHAEPSHSAEPSPDDVVKEQKRLLVEACSGDVDAAKAMWGDRTDPLSDGELEDLLTEARQRT